MLPKKEDSCLEMRSCNRGETYFLFLVAKLPYDLKCPFVFHLHSGILWVFMARMWVFSAVIKGNYWMCRFIWPVSIYFKIHYACLSIMSYLLPYLTPWLFILIVFINLWYNPSHFSYILKLSRSFQRLAAKPCHKLPVK